jgi:hypothetical protein
MLTKIELKKYRGFPSYKMEGLAQVNLLVGKNNSGKTALLEGAQFLLSGGDPSVLEDAAQRRGEVVVPRSERAPLIDPSHFFHGHVLAPDAEFSIAGNNGYKPVQVKIAAAKSKQEEGEPSEPRSRYSHAVLRIDGGRIADSDARMFRITREGGVDLDVGTRPRRLGLPRLIDGPAVRFVGTDSLNMLTLGALWDEVQLSGSEEGVAGALRVLEPDVSSVHMLTGMSAYGFYSARAGAVVGFKDKRQRIPLGSMGEGMRRMLGLATSLACTTDGALFIDEIDTGLHYSVMRDMWKLVAERATNSNVQVFATTHSWDCIEGLSLLCQDNPSLRAAVSIQKIDRTLKHSIAFAGDSVARMERQHIDPR